MDEHDTLISNQPKLVTANKSENAPSNQLKIRSIEWLIYIGIIIWCHYLAFTSYSEASSPYASGEKWLPGLADGFIPGRKRDNRDYQYRFFRDSLVLVSAALAGFVAISQLVARLSNNHIWVRCTLYCLTSLGFLAYCHGSGALFPIVIVIVNFGLARVFRGTKLCVPITWISAAVVLLLNERYDGYRFAAIHPSIAYWDQYKGLFGWHSLFNLVVLRMISFNLDSHWSVASQNQSKSPDSPCRSCQTVNTASNESTVRLKCLACREWQSRSANEYSSFMLYFAYLFYIPLQLAGPIITFNAFVSFLHQPVHTPMRQLAVYVARWLLCLALFEVGLHYTYVFAIPNHPPAFQSLSLLQLTSLVHLTLTAIWLKFLVIWRFFRFWSLLDGVVPCENMTRCVNAHHSVRGFWREWHRSFNRWLMRYIYLPLGGNHTSESSQYRRTALRCFNVFAVFAWVSFWHDRTLQLLTWGMFIALIFVPEIAGSSIAHKMKWTGSPYFRHIESAFGAANIVLMMAANLIGYGVGLSGTTHVFEAFQSASFLFAFTIWLIFFAFVQVQLAFDARFKQTSRLTEGSVKVPW